MSRLFKVVRIGTNISIGVNVMVDLLLKVRLVVLRVVDRLNWDRSRSCRRFRMMDVVYWIGMSLLIGLLL